MNLKTLTARSLLRIMEAVGFVVTLMVTCFELIYAVIETWLSKHAYPPKRPPGKLYQIGYGGEYVDEKGEVTRR